MGSRRLRAAVIGTALVLLAAGCTKAPEPPGPSPTTLVAGPDPRVAVAPMSPAGTDALCDAVRAGVEAYTGTFEDSSDEVGAGRPETCRAARGNGLRDHAVGLLRVHDFTAEEVAAYADAVAADPGAQSQHPECFAYWTLLMEQDKRVYTGPTAFAERSAGAREYCGAESDTATVAAIAVHGSIVVLEFEAVGTIAGRPADANALRDAVLAKVFGVL